VEDGVGKEWGGGGGETRETLLDFRRGEERSGSWDGMMGYAQG
jgi:hypothetical protein